MKNSDIIQKNGETCKIEEMKQQISPFSDPMIRQKSIDTIEERYGVDRKEIREKISKAKLSKETKEKFEKTCMEKYGVRNPFQSEEIKEKIKQTSLEKYGTEHHMQNEEIKNKTKETYIEKYGVDNPMRNEEIKKKSIKTNNERYGHSNPMQNEEVRGKAKNTNIERYGVDVPLKSPDILNKMKETNIKKYGNPCPMQNEEIIKIIKENNKEKWGHENPFGSKEIRGKILKKMVEDWGVKFPSQNKEIRDKIIKTNLNNYGVDNPSKSEYIKNKTLGNNLKKYGVEYPTQLDFYKEKIKETCLEKYGVDNPMLVEDFKNKMLDSFSEIIKENKNGNFNLINLLRNDKFWEDIAKYSLTFIADKYNLKYNSLATELSRDEFKERYNDTYSYPKFQIQKSIYDLIKSYGFKTEFNTRKIISPYELDIYIPEKKFAIEFNGSYWHSEAVLENGKAYRHHRNKLDLCRENGIYLFNIFEHQWKNRETQILNFIKTILGINSEKIAGRKCIVTNDEQKKFMNDNHIQGYGQGTIKWFNLEYNGEVVASMTASHHHRQNVKRNNIVLNRLCFKDGVNVQGGASKLFKTFKRWAKDEKYDGVISWSDNCWTEGKIYGVLGFELEEEYNPDYFYWDKKNDCYRSKQSQTKRINGCPKEVTERDWCYSLGLYRIYDCGKKRWMYNLNDGDN